MPLPKANAPTSCAKRKDPLLGLAMGATRFPGALTAVRINVAKHGGPSRLVVEVRWAAP